MRPTSRLAAVAGTLALTAGVAWPAGTAAAMPQSNGVVQSTHSEVVQSNIADDADWLLQGQLPDGAIAWYVDRRHISPYLANYAALGLAEAHKQTGATAYSDAAWSWLAWYAAHQDARGVVTDYDVDAGGVETSTGDEDSTDSYAGTYLSAVRATYTVDPSSSRLGALHTSIAAAVVAIEATQDVDGLTWAKPSWHVKYLMDETEAYDGLLSAADLAGVLGDGGLRTRASNDAARLKMGIAALWDAPTGAYDWAKNDGGGVTATDWNVLYSDSLEQAWLAGSSAVATTRARNLLNAFGAAQPQWSVPNAVADMNGDTGTVGYWPVAGWALLHVGRIWQAASAADSIRSAAVANGRAWPFTTGDAGQLIVLESGDTTLITP